MAETAAQLVDSILPRAPVRQWVLTLPFFLRYRLAYDAGLTREILGIFIRALFASLRRRARRRRPLPSPQCGAVTFIQRFGDALNLNVHFHTLVLDGVYDGDPDLADPLPGEEPLLAALYGASVHGRVATGPRAGCRLVRFALTGEGTEDPPRPGTRCVTVEGVSVHAEVAVPARDRKRLQRLARYTGRPPVATRRLSRLPDGRLLYRLKRRWRDGTTHVVFEPLELLEKLAALVPPPRVHQIRYHGILGPAAGGRSSVVPAGAGAPTGHTGSRRERFPRTSRPGADLRPTTRQPTMGAPDPGPQPDLGRNTQRSGSRQTVPAGGTAARQEDAPGLDAPMAVLSWAELIRRVFAVDVLECPRCGGRMRILAAIQTPGAIRDILEHLGLPSRAPPIHPARRPSDLPPPRGTPEFPEPPEG
jgi:hypothetical protein